MKRAFSDRYSKTALILLWLCSALSFPLLRADTALTQWVHEQWQTDRGLPQNSVFCFAQDGDGFLWLGTENGLVRFDGAEFKVFNDQSDPPFPHDFISSLLRAKDGSIWAGNRRGGLARYRDGAFDVPIPALGAEKVLAMAQTLDGSIWIGTPQGLKRIEGSTVTTFSKAEGMPHDRVSALCSSVDGSLWVGFGNGATCNFAGGKLSFVPKTENFRESAVTAIAEDARSRALWIARDGPGLFRFDEEGIQRVELLGRGIENFQALHVDEEGGVWVGSQYDGLLHYKNGGTCALNAQNGLGVSDVVAVFEDREGSIWAGTLFGGLHRVHKGQIATFGRREGLHADMIGCLLEPRPGVLWFGTQTDGAMKYEDGEFTPISLPQLATDIRAMCKTREGDIWIGGAGQAERTGLFRLRSDGTTNLLTTKDGLVANEIGALYQMRNGELWVGSLQNGISVVSPSQNRVIRTHTNHFFRTYIRCFGEDAEGTIWIGTQNGLVRYKNGSFVPNYLTDYADASIRSLHFDNNGTLWIGTRDDGLLRLSGGTVFQFGPATGIKHTRIYQLVKAGPDFWLAGNRGIERVSFEDLESVAAGQRKSVETRLFRERDGLRTVECTGDANPMAIATSDGMLWFATRRGLARFNPQVSEEKIPAPAVILTKVRVDRVALEPSQFHTVPPGSTRLQFSYAAPSFRSAGSVLYRYKLDGVDKDWIEAGREREAAYYNLKPGPYTFHVVASNNRGEWPPQHTSLGFMAAPQFYQTTWFIGAALLAGVSSIGGLYRWRVSGIRRRNEALEELVQDRTQELRDEITHRKEVEQQQIALNAYLEQRVLARTSELSAANETLQAELQERERVERALATSEARLRRVVDSGMVGILFWRQDGRIYDANDTFLRMVGYSRLELEAGIIRWNELIPPEQSDSDMNALAEIQRTGVCMPFEKEYVRKDGSRFPIMMGGASLGKNREEGVCFVLDISERIASEEKVRQLAQSLEVRVHERTNELARINEQLATEVYERKRVAIALSAFSQLGQKLHGTRTEKEAANIIALTAKSLIPHDICSIELYGPNNQLYPVIQTSMVAQHGAGEAPSSISVSIRNGSRVIGVIGLKSSSDDAFNIGDANTLQALGDYCGGALDRIHAEEARRETERRFAAFMTNAPVLAWMKDADLRYIFTNPVFQKFLGLSAAEIEGKTDHDLWPEATASRIRGNDLRVFELDRTCETQDTLRRADEESRILLTLRFPFTTATGERFVAGMALDITEQKRAEEALHRLPQSILEAQEQERRRLARELHDSVNQAIASVKFRIQTAENQILRGDAKWQESCNKSKQMLDSVLQQVRHLSHSLRPGELDDLGLLAAARTAFHEFEARTGIIVHFSAREDDARLDPALESTLYRIIQEALTNIEKHSSATEVEIQLNDDGSSVTLEICDNGAGFDAPEIQSGRKGLGLLHMRERATLLGGDFSLETHPGGGVRIRVQAPLRREGETTK